MVQDELRGRGKGPATNHESGRCGHFVILSCHNCLKTIKWPRKKHSAFELDNNEIWIDIWRFWHGPSGKFWWILWEFKLIAVFSNFQDDYEDDDDWESSGDYDDDDEDDEEYLYDDDDYDSEEEDPDWSFEGKTSDACLIDIN